ncbi:MAG: restriction endonuclease [Candidatus Scatosoma sp.]
MEQETVTQKQEKRQAKTGVTRAAKASRQKEILRTLLKNRPYKWNELLEEAVKTYVEKFGDEPVDVPDLKGKFGSNFSLLEEAGEVAFDKTTNLCSLVVPARKERKTAQTKRAVSSPSGAAAGAAESETGSAKEAAKEAAKPAPVKSRRTKTKRTAEEPEGAAAKNNVEPFAVAAQTEAVSGERSGEAGKKLSSAISADEEKRAAIETALKKAVEKAAAGKAARTPVQKSVDHGAEGNTTEAEWEEKTAKKTPKKRGAKLAETAPAPAQSVAAPVAQIASDGAAATETAEKPVEKPAEKPAVGAAEIAAENAKTEKNAADKAAGQPEKKAVKSELLLTEFAFLGNAAKRAENAPKATNANNAEKAGSGVKEATKEEDKAAHAAGSGVAENAKNVRGMGENNDSDAKNAAPVGANNAQTAQTAQNVADSAAKAVSARPQNTQSQNTQSQNTQSIRNAENGRRQNAQNARGGETRRNGATAAVGGRTGVKYALVQSADDKLKEEFLRRLRSMSGEYFEYYAVYLLERYSLKNGRRLEGLRVSGGKNDGGIDGEIELTDRFGFRETIYIQAKNWDPTKGVAEKWTIGETLIQQFVGAATCRQSKDGKRNCRGIFMTTSTFTKEAKEILSVLGEKFIGYDGDDVYEAAKECSFGVIQVNGVWQLDEKLLSGDKAFFNM